MQGILNSEMEQKVMEERKKEIGREVRKMNREKDKYMQMWT